MSIKIRSRIFLEFFSDCYVKVMNTPANSIFSCLAKLKDPKSGRQRPRGCLIIGDSMIRNLDPTKFDQDVYLFAYPGIKARQLWNQVKIWFAFL